MANKGDIKIISKKQGLKKALKELAKLEKSCVTVGIHKGQGRLKKTVSGRGPINMATLAKLQETAMSWIQKNTVVIPCADGDDIIIPKGARLNKPARIFVNLQKVPDVYGAIQNFISDKIRSLLSKSIKTSMINSFWNTIGEKILLEQKNRIQLQRTDKNSEITQKIKGFNHPLFDTGALLNALSFKRITGKKKSVLDNIKIDLDTK